MTFLPMSPPFPSYKSDNDTIVLTPIKKKDKPKMENDKFMGLNPWAKALVNQFETVTFTGIKTTDSSLKVEFEMYTDPGKPVIGLKLNKSSIPVELVRKSYKRSLVRRKVIDTIYSIFIRSGIPPYKLYEYILPDGRVFREYVQFATFTKGPIYFMALRDSKGIVVPESLWDDSVIDNVS